MQDIEAASQLVPCSWKYNSSKKLKKTSTNPIYHKPYFQPTETKSNVGPGQGYENIEVAFSKQILKRTGNFSVPKGKRLSFTAQKALQKQNIPGVGQYEGVYYYNSISQKSIKIRPFLKIYNIKRFTNQIMREKAWVPGPGAYELLRKPKKPKNNKDNKEDDE